jgi:hypothetical protein
MTMLAKSFAALALGGLLAQGVFAEGAFVPCAFADDTATTSAPAPTSAPAAGLVSTLLPIPNEPAPRLIVDAPVPSALARGAVLIPYRVENLRILPVLGPDAAKVSPRVGHLHITVDNLPWHWAEFGDTGTVVVVGLPAGPHQLRIEIASPEHHVYGGETVGFTLPVAAPRS